MPKSAANAVDDPTQTLQTFELSDLAQYTREGVYATTASADFHLFYVGRDDVHDLLKYVLSRVSTSLYLNMFGFDDQELNDIIMAQAANPAITTVITLDKSQSGGVHEKTILNSDMAKDPAAFNAHFAIGQSATHQITHTKGFVADGKVAGEGSTNWSAAGEGTFIVLGANAQQKAGFKAQNNTQSIITDPDTCARFTAELIAEHLVAKSQGGEIKRSSGKPSSAAARKRSGSSAAARKRSGSSATARKRSGSSATAARRTRSSATASKRSGSRR
jgi:hypothetical protein